MKPRKTTLLIALVVLLFAAFAVGMGQGTTQTDQKKKAESCCVEGAKCCEEGSCKEAAPSCCKEGASCCKEGAECCKHDANKEHDGCCGDSCELDAKGGDAKAKHKHVEGACCKAKQKEKSKTKARA
jgi:hypothetical protein